jgi:DNA recombination protein RmuC
MNENLIYILPAAALIIGIVITYFLTKSNLEKKTVALNEKINAVINERDLKQQELLNIKNDLETLRNEKDDVRISLSKKEEFIKHLERKLAEEKEEIDHMQEKFTKDFEILASKILEEKSEKFTARNKENIAQILNPLQEKIKSFEKKVEDTHKESLVKQSALQQQIIHLKELNEQMSKDAVNLTRALKGESKTQGDWGEFQLETLLEKAGLEKDIHYSTQGGFRDDSGNLKKPDFIIHLPDNKHLIIDSKVSLTGYEKYFNAETDSEKNIGIKSHLVSIKKHIRELGDKSYTDLYGINSPDYVLMFVPIEPALMLALHNDKSIYLEALDKNVVMVSTSTLLATLSTVASIWKQEDQKRNVIEIARQAGALYDKFEGLVQDLLKVGKQINASQESYKSAMNKLTDGKGNLITRVEHLKKLGAKTKKSIPDSLLDRAKEE